jgi:hypothetical protein
VRRCDNVPHAIVGRRTDCSGVCWVQWLRSRCALTKGARLITRWAPTATVFLMWLSGCSLLNQPINRASDDGGGVSLARDMALGGSDQSIGCTLLPQKGCGADKKCTLSCNPTDTTFELCGAGANNATTCAADGDRQLGGVCDPAPDNCVASTICIPDYGRGSQADNMMCRQFCNSDADCKQAAPQGEVTNKPRCTLAVAMTGLRVCTVACNPVNAAGPSGCPGEWFCNVSATDATDCRYNFGDGTPEGFGCNDNSDCGNGRSCVENGSAKLCRQNCRAANSGDCTDVAGATCKLPTGAVMFGVCCPPGGC